MNGKILLMLLALSVMAYATAPEWVAKGANAKYAVGNDTTSFTVLERTPADIKIELKILPSSKTYKLTENASAAFGQFWHDVSLLSGASVGSEVGDLAVSDKSAQTIAGREWDTITLQGIVSEAATKKTYDRKSGLLLKQTVDAPGAPLVILTQFDIPAVAGQAQLPPPATQPSPQANATAQPPAQNTTAPSQNATSPAQNETQPSVQNETAPSQPAQPSAEPGADGQKSDGSLCGSASILAMLAFAILGKG